MSTYGSLAEHMKNGRTLMLDGAVGTQLQAMGVPMDNVSWAAKALHTHPDTVRHMHRKYIECGVDFLTTNTYSSARHNLEPLGLGEATMELNLRAVNLAVEARERFATRPVAIAGSISNFGFTAGGEAVRALHRHANPRSEITEHQARANLDEQARILADAGVDLMIAESTGSMMQRRWVAEACLATGLPTWLGFRVRYNAAADMLESGYSSAAPFEDDLRELLDDVKPDAVALFHSDMDSIDRALPVLAKHWHGIVVVYPEAERADYTATYRDSAVASTVTPDDFAKRALAWRDRGVSVIGGCCGIDVEYIAALRHGLAQDA